MQAQPSPATSTPPSGCRLALESCAVLAGWLLLAVLRMPGVALHPTRALWGHPDTDTASMPWTFWHLARHLLSEGSLGLRTELVAYPMGGSFWPASPLEALLLAPVTALLGPVPVVNALQALHLALAGALCFALLVRLTGRRLAALAASPVLALSPVLICCAHDGNVEASQLFWMPACGLAALEAGRSGGWRLGLAGLLVAVALLSNPYAGIAAALAAGVLALWAGTWRRALALLLVGGALAAPVAAWALAVGGGSDALLVREAADVARQRLLEGQAALLDLVRPGAVAALDADGLPSAFLNGACAGLGALLLAASGLRAAPRRGAVLLAALALGGALLALGPGLVLARGPGWDGRALLALPGALLDGLPVLGSLVELWRFAMLLHFAVALAVGLGLAGRRPAQVLAAGALLMAEPLLWNPGPPAWRAAALPHPELAALAEGLEPGAVVHLPPRQGHWPLFYQTVHGLPIGSTMADGVDHAVLGQVVGEGWSLAGLRGALRERGYRWVFLDLRPELPQHAAVAALEGAITRAGTPARRAGQLVLLDLAAEGPWPEEPLPALDRLPLGGAPADRAPAAFRVDLAVELGPGTAPEPVLALRALGGDHAVALRPVAGGLAGALALPEVPRFLRIQATCGGAPCLDELVLPGSIRGEVLRYRLEPGPEGPRLLRRSPGGLALPLAFGWGLLLLGALGLGWWKEVRRGT